MPFYMMITIMFNKIKLKKDDEADYFNVKMQEFIEISTTLVILIIRTVGRRFKNHGN